MASGSSGFAFVAAMFLGACHGSSSASTDSDAAIACPTSVASFCGADPDLGQRPECAPDVATARASCPEIVTCGSLQRATYYFANETYATAFYDTATSKLVAVEENGDCAAGPSTFDPGTADCEPDEGSCDASGE